MVRYSPVSTPALADSQPGIVPGTETKANPAIDESQASEQLIEPDAEETPQPPLIDAQVDQVEQFDSIDKQTDIPPDDNTPQPPLIETQTKPNYEPIEETEAVIEDEKPDVTIAPAAEKQAEPDIAVIEPQQEMSALPADLSQQQMLDEQLEDWSDARPKRVDADWLQLTSGEWLRGRIIAMQKDDLEFDSDELDKLVIEWEKVKYIKSADPYRLRFDGSIDAAGTIEITQKTITVSTDYDDQVFERSKLLTIASGKDKEINNWSSEITFSVNIRRGNTDQTDFTSKFSIRRKTIYSRLIFDYLGNFTAIENTMTINNHRLNQTYDIFITRNLFVTPITTEYFRDPFQNIERRIYVGAGIGYNLINNDRTEWEVSAGPAYQSTVFDSVQPGQASEDKALTLILGTKFDIELNSMVDLEGSYKMTLGGETTGNYSHHSIFTVETELTDKLDFDVSLVWDRVRSPVADENNITPEQDDLRFLIGLGYDL